MKKLCLTGAGLHGMMAITFGAFAAHLLKAQVQALPPEQAARILGWVDTGAKYQLAHAAALAGTASLLPDLSGAQAKMRR